VRLTLANTSSIVKQSLRGFSCDGTAVIACSEPYSEGVTSIEAVSKSQPEEASTGVCDFNRIGRTRSR